METKTYEVKIKKLPQSKIEITATIPASEFDTLRSKAIGNIGADIELPGFRKGHAPEKMLAGKIGEGAILEEMAELAIGVAYPAIITSEKLDVLGRPEVRITKIAPGNPLEFTIVTAIFPEVTLTDYKKLATKAMEEKSEVLVTDEDIEKTINEIRRMRAQQSHHHAEGEEHKDDEPAPELPEFNDEFVKSLGEFANVEEFKTKLRENILTQKTREAKDKKRVALMEAIVTDAKIDVPEIVVNQELARMEDEFTHDVERMGMSMDAYLDAIKKTREEMHEGWKPDAEKRAKVQLIISKIAELEKITPSPEMLTKEVAALRERYPNAPEERIHGFVHMMLTNEKVFEFLEAQA